MGAKFNSGGGATVFYDDGPITAPSGEQGTQRTEFEAKIKSVTSSTTVGAVFIYDTRNDSDPSWRSRCQGLSWYDETLNTATRGGRREFPSVALIVADNGDTSNVTIYDLDDPAMPMWMVINRGAGHILFASGMGSVFALNGRLYVGHSTAPGALSEISFVDDYGFVRINSTTAYNGAAIADREVRTSDTATGTTGALVNRIVNDVSATIVEGAELGALGLPIPTLAVATDGGVSVIHPNGDVYNIQSTNASYRVNGKIQIDGKFVYFPLDSTSTNARTLQVHPIPYAAVNPTLSEDLVADKYATASTSGTAAMPRYLGNNTLQLAKFNSGFAVGTTTGLSLFKDNEGNRADGAVAHITSSYNTGYMLGDIKGAWLTGGDASAEGRYDNSVGNTDLVENGTVLHAAAETDAEVTKYYDFSASNYFSQANNTDFDFGTSDFSIMLWVKLANTVNATETAILRNDVSDASKATIGVDFVNGVPRLLAYGGGWNSTTAQTDLSDDRWHQVLLFRRSEKVFIYVDGKYDLSYTGGNTVGNDLSNNTATMRIGLHNNGSNPLANGSLALVRISATAPTPQQVKEIYEAEKPLFRSGAKCLLFANVVKDLAYDNSTGLLSVGQDATSGQDGVVNFRGLEKVSSFQADDYSTWSANTTHKLAAAGGVSAYGRTSGTGGVIVDLPPFDVRGDTNIADTKLPDDGKFHFSGVTVNATPTVIGQIPIAENESYTVIARVMGLRYNNANSDIRHFCEIKQQFTRRTGGDVVEETQISKLAEGDWASLNVDLDYDAGADTLRVEVTGDGSPSPGPYRVVWNAEVEVQRISEKQYER